MFNVINYNAIRKLLKLCALARLFPFDVANVG